MAAALHELVDEALKPLGELNATYREALGIRRVLLPVTDEEHATAVLDLASGDVLRQAETDALDLSTYLKELARGDVLVLGPTIVVLRGGTATVMLDDESGEAVDEVGSDEGATMYARPALPCRVRVVAGNKLVYDLRLLAMRDGGIDVEYMRVGEVAGKVDPIDAARAEANIHYGEVAYQMIGLPPAMSGRCDELIAAADAQIRAGLIELAERFGQLKQTKLWHRIGEASAPGRVGLTLSNERYEGEGEARVAHADHVKLSVSIGPRDGDGDRAGASVIYRGLKLYSVLLMVEAGETALGEAVVELVKDAAAPIEEMNRAYREARGVRRVDLPDLDNDRSLATVLELASGEMLRVPDNAPDAMGYLTRFDVRGDLIFDGGQLGVIRGGRARSIRVDRVGGPWPIAGGEVGVNMYRLRDLPRDVRIATGDGVEFDVRLIAEQGAGIRLEYQPTVSPLEGAGATRMVHLPDADPDVHKTGRIRVLDLSSGQWVVVPRQDEVEDDEEWALSYVAWMGKGDLCWSRGLWVWRGGTVRSMANGEVGEAWEIERQEGEHEEKLDMYRLPSLPCDVRFTTADGKAYDVQILAKRDGGIDIKYRRAVAGAGDVGQGETVLRRLAPRTTGVAGGAALPVQEQGDVRVTLLDVAEVAERRSDEIVEVALRESTERGHTLDWVMVSGVRLVYLVERLGDGPVGLFGFGGVRVFVGGEPAKRQAGVVRGGDGSVEPCANLDAAPGFKLPVVGSTDRARVCRDYLAGVLIDGDEVTLKIDVGFDGTQTFVFESVPLMLHGVEVSEGAPNAH